MFTHMGSTVGDGIRARYFERTRKIELSPMEGGPLWVIVVIILALVVIWMR